MNLDHLFDGLVENIEKKRSVKKSSTMMSESASIGMESSIYSSRATEDQIGFTMLSNPQEYSIQQAIRPLFGKTGINTTPIGAPPQIFDQASIEEIKHHFICTIFIDIKGSTRLSLLYPLDLVYKFKNAVLTACIEVVRSFDGCVHRLMGDAVMAFFGGPNITKEDAINDAINCSTTLRALLESNIRPWMTKNNMDHSHFGFRIGCEFGDDEDILWGRYGYSYVGEITATGLPVDIASKMQSMASKNETMVGRNLIEFIDLPENVLLKKKTLIDGQIKEIDFVEPNITDNTGKTIDYKTRMLNYDFLLKSSALPESTKEKISSHVISNANIEYRCFVDASLRQHYPSGSSFINKGLGIEFELSVKTRSDFHYPLKVEFRKMNTGKETPENERCIEQKPVVLEINPKRETRITCGDQHKSSVILAEASAYRGSHFMKCEVTDARMQVIYRNWITILIR